MANERENWRKAFELLGPEQLRLRLEYRRNEYTGDYGREAEVWLFEKAAEAAAVDRGRFQTVRRWSKPRFPPRSRSSPPASARWVCLAGAGGERERAYRRAGDIRF